MAGAGQGDVFSPNLFNQCGNDLQARFTNKLDNSMLGKSVDFLPYADHLVLIFKSKEAYEHSVVFWMCTVMNGN